MQQIPFAVWLVGAFVSLALTLKYLPAGVQFLLCLPFFPFFGVYAGVAESDWIPSILFFGSLTFGALFSKRRTEPSD